MLGELLFQQLAREPLFRREHCVVLEVGLVVGIDDALTTALGQEERPKMPK